MIEIYIWLGVAAFGLVLSSLLVNESRLDLEALGERRNGRRRAAVSRLIREAVRSSVHAGYVGAGLAALDILFPRDVIVPLLIWGSVALVLNSAIDYFWRPDVTDRAKLEEENGSGNG